MRKSFKVCDKEKVNKTGIVVSSLQELKTRLCEKFNLPLDFKLTLEEDGTEVDDEEYFSFLPENTMFTYSLRQTVVKEECLREKVIKSMLEKIGDDIVNCIFLTEDEMTQFIEANSDDLARYLGKSKKVVKSVKDFLQHHIDERTQCRDILQCVQLLNR